MLVVCLNLGDAINADRGWWLRFLWRLRHRYWRLQHRLPIRRIIGGGGGYASCVLGVVLKLMVYSRAG